MAKLFIYYSNTGSGEVVASKMASLGYELRKVQPKKDLPKKFFFKVVTGGFLASLNVKTKLVDYDNDISSYEKIVIGSPIWNGRLSTPINTVLNETNFEGKDVSFILYSGSGEAKKAPKQIEKFVKDANIINLKEPKNNMDELEKIN